MARTFAVVLALLGALVGMVVAGGAPPAPGRASSRTMERDDRTDVLRRGAGDDRARLDDARHDGAPAVRQSRAEGNVRGRAPHRSDSAAAVTVWRCDATLSASSACAAKV